MTKWYNQPARELIPPMTQKGILDEIEIIEDLVDQMNAAGQQAATVSYTHLTLPTIYSV